jgi:hypothetical protein
MTSGTGDFSVGDRVFVHHAPDHADAPDHAPIQGEVVSINDGVATIDVKVVVRGRPSYLTKRPWDLEKVQAP